MNRINLDRRTQAIAALVEGNSIRSTERMTGIHRDTIMPVLLEVGTGCAALMDEKMRELPCRRVQVDEIWSYVGKKQRHLKPTDDRSRVGDEWTFVAHRQRHQADPELLGRQAHGGLRQHLHAHYRGLFMIVGEAALRSRGHEFEFVGSARARH